MKWFKHYTKALSDAKIEKLIMKYGIEGYGLYFACLELIAGNLADENITFELEHDSEILAYKFKIDTLRIEEMMKYMVHLELFEVSEVSNKITCMKLAKNLDSSSVKNPHLLLLKKKIQEKSRKVEITQEKSSQIRIEENRKEENRKEEKKRVGFQPPSLSEIEQYLNEHNIKSFTSNQFFNFYESKGWYVGKNKMKNWHSAIAGWVARDKDKQPKQMSDDELTEYLRKGKEKFEEKMKNGLR